MLYIHVPVQVCLSLSIVYLLHHYRWFTKIYTSYYRLSLFHHLWSNIRISWTCSFYILAKSPTLQPFYKKSITYIHTYTLYINIICVLHLIILYRTVLLYIFIIYITLHIHSTLEQVENKIMNDGNRAIQTALDMGFGDRTLAPMPDAPKLKNRFVERLWPSHIYTYMFIYTHTHAILISGWCKIRIHSWRVGPFRHRNFSH